MPDYSLIIARSQQDAIISAVMDWKWEQTGSPDFHLEFRRPDNNERVRYITDRYGVLCGLRWQTKVYLANGHERRRDWEEIKHLIDIGLFMEGDPTLPPPKPRKLDGGRFADEMRLMLRRLGGE